jgi:tripartite-type tricarboxylate transporter receptor subunit TctC
MLHARRVIVCASGALIAAAVPAAADSVADFYKGKTVSILMGTTPGGSYDLYGRVIGEHLSRHIPGNPTVIMEHMPGAGGVIAGNHIFGPGPQDGTKILLSHSIPLAEKLEPKGVRFEAAKFQWLGTFDAIAHTMTIWGDAKVDTLEALKSKPLVIGSFAKGHLTYQWAAMTKHVLGANYQVITGYRSGSDLNLAMERGEVQGWAASWENLVGTRPQWLTDKKISVLISFTLERKKQIPDVPTLLELAPAGEKDIVEFLAAATPFGRAMTVGPGVPADRVAALRKAFDDTMKDPAFLAEAAKRKLDIDARPASYPHALAAKLASASPELVARVKKAIGME